MALKVTARSLDYCAANKDYRPTDVYGNAIAFFLHASLEALAIPGWRFPPLIRRINWDRLTEHIWGQLNLDFWGYSFGYLISFLAPRIRKGDGVSADI